MLNEFLIQDYISPDDSWIPFYPLYLVAKQYSAVVQCHVNSKLMVLLCLDGLQLYIFTMMFVKSFTTLYVVQVEMVNNITHCNEHIFKRMRTNGLIGISIYRNTYIHIKYWHCLDQLEP